MGPDHTPRFAMPMTAVSVAQRCMGFKASRAQEMSPLVALPGFPRIQQAGRDEKEWKRGAILPWIQQGGYMATQMACHREIEESKQVRDDPSTKQALKLHQGRAQGGDKAPLAAIARASAAESETWSLVLCLRM